MKGKYFLDTNILVYSFDHRARRKQAKSQELIEAALQRHQGIISTQVLQEFLNVATTKFSRPLSAQDAYRYLDSVLAPLCEVYPSLALYRQGLNIQTETHYSFYDSLILAAAIHANCDILYSEDFQHDQRIRGLRIDNPFH